MIFFQSRETNIFFNGSVPISAEPIETSLNSEQSKPKYPLNKKKTIDMKRIHQNRERYADFGFSNYKSSNVSCSPAPTFEYLIIKETPLHLAIKQKNIKIITILMENGASVPNSLRNWFKNSNNSKVN